MEQYTLFAKVYDRMMDNIPYEEWEQYLLQLLFSNAHSGVADEVGHSCRCLATAVDGEIDDASTLHLVAWLWHLGQHHSRLLALVVVGVANDGNEVLLVEQLLCVVALHVHHVRHFHLLAVVRVSVEQFESEVWNTNKGSQCQDDIEPEKQTLQACEICF